MEEPLTLRYRSIVTGNAGVGKTSIIMRTLKDEFKDDYKMTVGFDFNTLKAETEDYTLSLTLVEVGGQKRFQAVAQQDGGTLSSANVYIAVYDEKRTSLERVSSGLETLLKKGTGKDPVLIIVRNKIDLPGAEYNLQEEEQTIKELEALALKYDVHVLGDYKTSAKEKIGWLSIGHSDLSVTTGREKVEQLPTFVIDLINHYRKVTSSYIASRPEEQQEISSQKTGLVDPDEFGDM